MKNKNKILLTAATVIILGGATLGSSQVFAQDTTTDKNQMSSLVQKISDKFGLNKADVQAVFDASRTERQTQEKANFETQLSKLVTEGKITEAQKQLIITKTAEMQAKRKANMATIKNKTPEERKAAMNTERTALQKWAKQNGISMSYLRFGHGKRHGGPRGFGGRGMNGETPPAQ